MKKTKRILLLAVYLFIICIGSIFNRLRWGVALRRRGCHALGKALNLRFDVRSLKVDLKGRVRVNDLMIVHKAYVLNINNLTCTLSPRSILKGKPRCTFLNIDKIVCSLVPFTFEKPAIREADQEINTTFLHRYLSIPGKCPGLLTYMPKQVFIQQLELFARMQQKDEALKLKNVQPEFEIVQTGNNQLSLYCKMKNYRVNWQVLCPDEIDIPASAVRIDCDYTANSFTIKKSSFFQFNELNGHFSGTLSFTGETMVDLQLSLDAMNVNSFLASFPYFTTRQLYRFLFTGSIPAIDICFTFKPATPFDYYFHINTATNDPIQVASIPEDWTDINLPFTYRVYDDDNNLIRSISLSAANENYRSIDQVPEQLAGIIIITEDQNFFTHYGVDDFYIGYAIIHNMLNRKLLRGGSTITMQLVKNLFLRRDKNLYRKVEELFITLLLENVFRIPKTKLLEIYLNIIEFAPGIYGIAEASEYYFSKPPEALTVKECLILTYIIPRPKYFMEAFQCASRQLKCNLKEHIRYTSEKLLQKGIITVEDMKTLSPEVSIQGNRLSLEEVS